MSFINNVDACENQKLIKGPLEIFKEGSFWKVHWPGENQTNFCLLCLRAFERLLNTLKIKEHLRISPLISSKTTIKQFLKHYDTSSPFFID